MVPGVPGGPGWSVWSRWSLRFQGNVVPRECCRPGDRFVLGGLSLLGSRGLKTFLQSREAPEFKHTHTHQNRLQEGVSCPKQTGYIANCSAQESTPPQLSKAVHMTKYKLRRYLSVVHLEAGRDSWHTNGRPYPVIFSS